MTAPLIGPAAIPSATDMLRRVDPLVRESFAQLNSVPPCVHIFTRSELLYAVDLLPLFQATDPQEAARKKLALVPTVREYIESRKLDVLGYVFLVMGYTADRSDPDVQKSMAAGKPVARAPGREQAVIYAAEMYEYVNCRCGDGERRKDMPKSGQHDPGCRWLLGQVGSGVRPAGYYPPISYAYGQRVIQMYPRKLLDLEVSRLEREPRGTGYGVLIRDTKKANNVE